MEFNWIVAEPIHFSSRTKAYAGFSNYSPHGFKLDGVRWATVEHYFQAQKFDDPVHRERIRRAATPGRAKRLGRSRAHPLRADWQTVREDVMLEALRLKFSAAKLRKLLLSTDDRPLIERAANDPYWGDGPDGRGQNRLGVLLMKLRDELRGR